MIKRRFQPIKFALCILVPLVIGALGALFVSPSIDVWYSSLIKASFNPPNWIFAPVWNFLYVLMGIAIYLVWTSDNKNKTLEYILFAVQLILNLFWSIIFFGLHSPFWALIEICVLFLAILANMVFFYEHSKAASWLLLPYLLWVIFAALLNLSIVILN